LFGFSGGAQFAHRFAMLHPDCVAALVIASAGWYTFPVAGDPFPYGLSTGTTDGQRAAANLARFLQIPTLTLVGERDTRRDPGLRKEPRVDDRQGLNRIERAERWTTTLRAAAAEMGVAAEREFVTIPNCGHSFDHCVEHGGLAWRAMAWFDGRRDRAWKASTKP
jgi:pimeloyl-ACP methyl ester carboxylesterase